ncbi:MAG TPA: GatB/YqeY domain-containing protein [Spirochaetota bacterium]|nr:GatB/YqeY domain-containing protein [Spirochaetota bacterium]HOR43432.1 GatB/YqeY domain-containing protein [Spirochaetota bacterium]HOU83447.1 GatB/YqeY domain-containing protein [Spirochaetota bacterium]HPK56386.1 GatB/YqeY domain-containing protein [Spirochaetota bacterium]HQE58417.1 GatB/YqeY domain-containing protein [Spirochaetota bacterium]
MSLFKKIESDLQDSLKSGNELRLSVLRMLKSDIMYEKNKTGKDLPEDKILETVSRAAKRRKESITEFDKAGRTDLSDKEKKELLIIEEYLPKQMTETEISAFVEDFISKNGKPQSSETGRFIGMIMKDLKGRADGSLVKEIVSKKISN